MVDVGFQQVVDLLLARRREEHEAALGRCTVGAGESLAPALARRRLVGAFVDVLEAHGREVLRDLILLHRLFGEQLSHEQVGNVFASHLDRLVAQQWPRLDGGASAAERNRFANAAAALKGRASDELGREAARAERPVDEGHDPAPGGAELDDRLPLARRVAFDRDLVEMAQRTKRQGESLALIMMDLDHFKAINDRYGHPAGDEVLLAVAESLVKRLSYKGRGYRYGGEEFAVLLPGYSAEEALGLAERIRKDVRGSVVGRKQIRVTLSLGVAALQDHASDPRSLLERADAALYEAKRQGRDQARSDQAPE